jgi:hypothetical protein
MQMATGHFLSRLVYAAATFGIADHLADGPKSSAKIAGATGCDPHLPPLPGTLTNFEIVTMNEDGRFTLTPIGEALKSDSPGLARSAVLTMGRPAWALGRRRSGADVALRYRARTDPSESDCRQRTGLMSIPTAVFLDPSALDGAAVQLPVNALATFAPACAKRSMKLLLTDPTEREIKRYLRERTIEAMAALEGLRRKARYLANWKGLARQFGSAELELFNAQNAAGNEWETFLKQLSAVRLGYTGLDVGKVMKWYDGAEPPFREGKKRKDRNRDARRVCAEEEDLHRGRLR